MKLKLGHESIVAALIVFSILASSACGMKSMAYAQQTQKTSIDYIENARSLLKQVSMEYKNGNYAKAQELADSAYLENFEYAEADLQKHGQNDLMEELEKMMVTDLRGMIRDKVSQDKLDAEINAIDAKLAEAITVVPEFPAGASMIIISVIGSVIAIARLKKGGTSKDMMPKI